VLLSVWLVVRARRRGRPLWRGLLDASLAAVVVLQLAMAMTSIGRTYPFIGFTMYGEVYRDADVLFTPSIVGRGTTGHRELHGGLLAFATDGVWRHLTTLLHADRALRNAFLARLDGSAADVELRIRRCRLTANGPREVAPWVLDRFAREGPR